MSRPRATRRRLLEFALRFPGAWLDHPWGEDVAKVGKKVFVFLGAEDDPAHLGMSVKLDGPIRKPCPCPARSPPATAWDDRGGSASPSGTPPRRWTS
jgi:hypothetical protein